MQVIEFNLEKKTNCVVLDTFLDSFCVQYFAWGWNRNIKLKFQEESIISAVMPQFVVKWQQFIINSPIEHYSVIAKPASMRSNLLHHSVKT